jgi:hypothetical protein
MKGGTPGGRCGGREAAPARQGGFRSAAARPAVGVPADYQSRVGGGQALASRLAAQRLRTIFHCLPVWVGVSGRRGWRRQKHETLRDTITIAMS